MAPVPSPRELVESLRCSSSDPSDPSTSASASVSAPSEASAEVPLETSCDDVLPLKSTELDAVRKTLIALKPAQAVSEDFSALRHIYNLLYSSLRHAYAGGVGRPYCLAVSDALGVFYLRCTQILSHPSEDTELWRSFLIERLLGSGAAEPTAVFRFVVQYSAEAGSALGNSLRDLLQKLLQLLKAVAQSPSSVAQLQEIIRNWLTELLSQPQTFRSVYTLLELLCRHTDGSVVLSVNPKFPETALSLIRSPPLANPVAKAVAAVFGSIRAAHPETPLGTWTALWAPHVLTELRAGGAAQKNAESYVLPGLFRAVPDSFYNFVSLISPDELSVLVGVLRVGQSLGICADPFETRGVDVVALSAAVHHQSGAVRLAVLALFVASQQGSRPVSEAALRLVEESWDDFFVEPEVELRNEYFGLMRQFIFRLRDSAYAQARESRRLKAKPQKSGESVAQSSTSATTPDEYVATVRSFFRRFLYFLTHQIDPAAPYRRRQLGMRLLGLLIRAGIDASVPATFHEKQHIDFPFSETVYTPTLLRLLFDNAVNDYEDIREAARQILQMQPQLRSLLPEADWEEIQTRAVADLHGIRGRSADGAARVLQVIFQASNDDAAFTLLGRLVANLCGAVNDAELDFAAAVRSRALHGYFTALRLLVASVPPEALQDTRLGVAVREVITSIGSMWKLVAPVLSDEAPEGNLPEPLGADAAELSEFGSASQLILSYSWRAVREASGFLEYLLRHIPEADESADPVLPDAVVLHCATLIMEMLATVRHRGAFSSVYPAFVALCNRCFNSNHKSLSEKPPQWLRHNLQLLTAKAQLITRRSGGFPFLITAVLQTEPQEDRPLLSATVAELLQLAAAPVSEHSLRHGEKMDLPQVHAFNCLRAIFTETELSGPAARHVGAALTVALRAFAHPVWALRNCAVMLFSALLARVFGTKKVKSSRLSPNSVSARLFFARFGGVREELLRVLDAGTAGGAADVASVFPVLILLSRLECASGDSALEPFRPLVRRCLADRRWKVRELAARIVPNLYNNGVADVAQFLTDAVAVEVHNEQHGLLLACWELLKREKLDTGANVAENVADSEYYKLWQTILAELPRHVLRSRCYATALVYLRVVQLVLWRLPDSAVAAESGTLSATLRSYVHSLLPSAPGGPLDASKSLAVAQAAELLVEIDVARGAADDLAQDVAQLLVWRPAVHDVQLAVLRVCRSRLSEVCGAARVALFAAVREVLADPNGEFWSPVKAEAALLLLETDIHEWADVLDSGVSGAAGFYRDFARILAPYTSETHGAAMRVAAVEALGAVYGSLLAGSGNDATPDIPKWLALVAQFAEDGMPIEERRAALGGLSAFISASRRLGAASEAEPLVAQAYIGVYRALSDDDDEIRDSAAAFLGGVWGLSFAPTAVYAEKLFVGIIGNDATIEMRGFGGFGGSALVSEIKAGLRNELVTQEQIVANLNESLAVDHVLFAVEKQNLYRCGIAEFRVLRCLAGGAAASADGSADGSALLFALEKATEGRKDGFLGYLGRDEAYSAVMVALIELGFACQAGNVAQDALRRLKENFEAQNAHPFVIEELERVITES